MTTELPFSTIIGFLGVTLLLIAFGLNLFGRLRQDSRSYILLNALGAGLSCVASIMIKYLPFVILEAVWCITALLALGRKKPRIP